MKIIARITPRFVSHTIEYMDCNMCGAPIILTAHSWGQARRLQRQGFCHHHSAMRAAARRDFRLRYRRYDHPLAVRSRGMKMPRKGGGAA